MSSNFQLNYKHTANIRQICSGVIFVHICACARACVPGPASRVGGGG